MSTAIKKCVVCEWEGFVYARKVHCPACKSKNSLNNQPQALTKTKERKCECGCGSTVISPKRFVSGHNSMRNPDHIYRNGRAYKEMICTGCKKPFERRVDRKNKTSLCIPCIHKETGEKNKGRIIAAARKGRDVSCACCGKEIYLPLSRIKRNGRYCSIQCSNASKPIAKGFITNADNRGKKNGMYKHGKRIGGHVSKKKVREQVIDRDEHYCMRCGKPGPGLHLHRVIYGSQGGKYEVDNCVLLCPVHHEEVHTNKNKWMPVLKEFIRKQTNRKAMV